MDREQLIKELKLLDDGDLEPTYERIADYFLSHTEELRKETEELREVIRKHKQFNCNHVVQLDEAL